ncbi:hypothetical protein Pd630_LPD13105 (plasmid) [Rhodococcus opacus PD630]|nr:hypothetical protein Pd630_LPD13105 [Rhodococcus opacus PD630]
MDHLRWWAQPGAYGSREECTTPLLTRAPAVDAGLVRFNAIT